ncbi:MAG: RsmD family RNA methyltransferase [Chitinophagales bacterium]|nr:RsmD family RNA methyltransferase [Bacteroidota bacterium]
MRINAGKFKGRRFNPPTNLPARPTTDFAKEGLFNILTNNFDFEMVSFLDLFSGTGSLCYEMVSRGCEDIVCVELDKRSIDFIRKTSDELQGNINVMKMDVFEYIRTTKKKFDIIFAGPPYPLENIPALPEEIFEMQLLKPEGWFVLETNQKYKFDDHPHFIRMRNYGTTHFHVFGAEPTKK